MSKSIFIGCIFNDSHRIDSTIKRKTHFRLEYPLSIDDGILHV